MWINLLDNAVKFSPAGGTVNVHIARRRRVVTVSVTNSGHAVPPEEQEKIFNKFYQADKSHATEGNGIGLAIAKQVVLLHKGGISVENGDGTVTFKVTLPVGCED